MTDRKLIVTDLDGTLLSSDGVLSPGNCDALRRLGEHGWIRVVATGRSMYSARKVLSAGFPIDYLAFSSGAGIVDWHSQKTIVEHHMNADEGRCAIEALVARDLDFMIHESIPNNHRFAFRRSQRPPADFERRIARYRDHARPWDGSVPHRLCQLLAVEDYDQDSSLSELERELEALSIVLATSPLDHQSRWIEIFPAAVSKSQGAAAIARRLAIPHSLTAAIGNDYNDADLLSWAARSAVVANAPDDLRSRHEVVATNDDDGFSQFTEVLLARCRSARGNP